MKFKTICIEYDKNGNIFYKFRGEDRSITIIPLAEIVKFVSDPKNETNLKVSENGLSVEPIEKNTHIDISKRQIKIPEVKDIELMYGKKLSSKLNKEKQNWKVRTELTIMDYINNKDNEQICSVCGIRFTGKRDLVKSELYISGLVDSTAWFTINKSIRHINIKMMLDIYKITDNIKAIVIENSEKVKDFHKADWILSMVKKGIKVIIITSGDIFIKKSNESIFFGRVHSVYTTGITFNDFRTINNNKVNFTDYCKSLSLKASKVSNPLLDRQTVDENIPADYSILDDILKTIIPNCESINYFAGALTSYSDKMNAIKAEIYKLIKALIYKQEDKPDNRDILVGMNGSKFLDSSISKILENELNKKLTDGFNLNYRTVGSPLLNGLVLSALYEMKIIFMLTNCAEFHNGTLVSPPDNLNSIAQNKRVEKSFYFSNPAIVNRFTNLELRILNDSYMPLRFQSNINDRFGFIFESALIYNVQCALRRSGKNFVYMYKDTIGREYDFIVLRNKAREDRQVTFYEIKSCNSLETIVANDNLKWICSNLTNDVAKIKMNIPNENVERVLIYSGVDIEGKVKLSKDTDLEATVINVDSFITQLNNIE